MAARATLISDSDLPIDILSTLISDTYAKPLCVVTRGSTPLVVGLAKGFGGADRTAKRAAAVVVIVVAVVVIVVAIVVAVVGCCCRVLAAEQPERRRSRQSDPEVRAL